MSSILTTIDAAHTAAMAGMTISQICRQLDCHRQTAKAAVLWAAKTPVRRGTGAVEPITPVGSEVVGSTITVIERAER